MMSIWGKYQDLLQISEFNYQMNAFSATLFSTDWKDHNIPTVKHSEGKMLTLQWTAISKNLDEREREMSI